MVIRRHSTRTRQKKAHLLRWRPRPDAHRTGVRLASGSRGAASHLDLFLPRASVAAAGAELAVECVDADPIGRVPIGDRDIEEGVVAGPDVGADPCDLLGGRTPTRVELVDEELDATGPVEADVLDLAEDEGPADNEFLLRSR